MFPSLTWTAPANELKKILTTLFATWGFFYAKAFTADEGTQIETSWSFVRSS